MKRIFLITAFLLGFGVYVFSQLISFATVIWGNTSLTYNGNAQAPTATAVVLGTAIPVAITVTGQQTNAGRTAYTATATTTTGYQLLNATTSFTIGPATIPVQWGNTSLTYNGQSQAPTASVTGLGRDRLSLRISGGQTNVGNKYNATAALYPTNANYILNNASTAFNIDPATVAVQWGNTTLTYTGSPQAPEASATGVVNENLPITVRGAQTYVGGPYTATATLIPANNNYTLSNTSTTFTIVQSPTNTYTVVWSNTSLTYNGTPQAPTAVATNVQGATVAVTVSGAQTNAGNYTATAAVGPDYTYVTLTNATTQFVINRATVPVVWGNTTLTYTGSPQAPSATATGVINENLPLSVKGEQTNIGGPYTATAAFSQTSANYTLSNTTTTFEIIQSATNTYNVVWSNTSLTYNGNPQAPTATATNGQGATIAVTVTGEQTNAGSYTATAAAGPNTTGVTLTNASTPFVINRATVPVVWGNTTLTYTGSPQAPSATATGVMNENLPLSVKGEQTNIGGPYTATAAFSQTIVNYTLINTTTTFTIIQSSTNTYTVVWSNTSLTYNGNQQAPTAVATNGQGSTVEVTVTGAQTNAGSYTATAAAGPNTGVTLTNATTQFVINRATVPVVWGNTTLTYTGSPQAPSATATGVKNENLQLSVKGEQTNVGGPYTATAAFSQTNSNYTLSNTTTTFAIVQPNTTSDTYVVQWGDLSLTYTGNQQAPSATATNNLGQSVEVTVSGAQTNIGNKYPASAAPTVPNNNITLLNATTQFEIVPATISVAWGGTTLIFNGRPQAPTASARGVLRENLPLDVSGTQISIGKAYLATAALHTSNNNYVLINTTTPFDIIQQSINNYTVEWGNKIFDYNGQLQAPTATATNFQGQTLQITITGAEVDAGIDYLAAASPATPNSSIVLINPTTLFDITPETLEVAAVSETIEYGQTPVLAYTVKSGQLFDNNALTGALSVETLQLISIQPPYPVGEYVIAQGTLTASGNYRMTFTKGSLSVINVIQEQFDIIVNNKSAEYKGDKYYGDPAENGEDQALVFVLANPGETIAIGGIRQNPRTVALPVYGDNNFTITVTPVTGTPKDHTLIIERYYQMVYFEYPDVPTISCNTQTNGGLSFTGFQWYREGVAIPEATGQYYQVKDNAMYHCELTAINYSNTKLRTINVRSLDLRTSGILTAYPNPTQGKVTILRGDSAQPESSAKPKIQVFDLNGVLVLQPETNPFDMSTLPQGMYFIKMNGKTAKVIKTN